MHLHQVRQCKGHDHSGSGADTVKGRVLYPRPRHDVHYEAGQSYIHTCSQPCPSAVPAGTPLPVSYPSPLSTPPPPSSTPPPFTPAPPHTVIHAISLVYLLYLLFSTTYPPPPFLTTPPSTWLGHPACLVTLLLPLYDSSSNEFALIRNLTFHVIVRRRRLLWAFQPSERVEGCETES